MLEVHPRPRPDGSRRRVGAAEWLGVISDQGTCNGSTQLLGRPLDVTVSRAVLGTALSITKMAAGVPSCTTEDLWLLRGSKSAPRDQLRSKHSLTPDECAALKQLLHDDMAIYEHARLLAPPARLRRGR